MLENYLRDQDGLITVAQAHRAGLRQTSINRRVQSGSWRRCAPGVYFADDRPFTDAARVRAAVWSYGEHAIASGLAAAWWHELIAQPPGVIEVTVPRNSHGRNHFGTRVRRRDIAELDIVERRGLRLTAPALTVLEAAVARGGGPRVMDSALQRRLTLDELRAAHRRNARRYGARAAQQLLDAASDGSRSQAERLLVQLLRDAGITGWYANYPVGGYKVDIGFPVPKVALEADGWAFHSDHDDFRHDRVRQNRIALLGWQVLRFTWFDLIEHPQQVTNQIHYAVLAR